MNKHDLPSVNSLREEQHEGTDLNELNPIMNFEKLGTSNEDIQNEEASLTSGVKDLATNNFPVDVFPKAVQQVINSTNECLKYPIDFIGSSLLYAASVAIGNTHRVEVQGTHTESAVLYLAIVGQPGTAKSHPLSFALQPIYNKDKHSYQKYEEDRKEYNRQMRLFKKNENKGEETEEPEKPVWRKLLLSDYTPEALAEVHKNNKRGIGVHVDELAGWFKNFNRYNKGSEMEFWLSVWSGNPINIDRKTGEPVLIPMPFISVAGTIQTGIINEIAKDNRTQNGFIDRILFVIPDNIRKQYWSEKELDPQVKSTWQTILSNLLELPLYNDDTNNPIPKILKFTPDARRTLFDWQRSNTDLCNESDNETIAGVFSKMDMYVVRLALILEMMRFASNEGDCSVVGNESIEGAIRLIEYFRHAAVKVQSIISNDNPLTRLPSDKQLLYNTLPETFTTAEGLSVSDKLNISPRTFKDFIKNRELFNRIKQGEYDKIL